MVAAKNRPTGMSGEKAVADDWGTQATRTFRDRARFASALDGAPARLPRDAVGPGFAWCRAIMTLERILVPVDYSQCSRAALRFAIDLARRFGASLDVVHVWDRPSYVGDAILAHTEPRSGKSLIFLIQENAQRDFDEFLAQAPIDPDVRHEQRLLSGDPASALLHELKQGRHDAVVVGTHGRTGLSHALLGSVAEKLARLSPVPVVTVPDDARSMARRT